MPIFQRLKHSAGFTMIELLVVIAIIGVLAAAVLSAINPVEQINKGRDTARRSDAAELANSIERFYAVQEAFPWNRANTTVSYTPGANLDVEAADGTGGDAAVDFLFEWDGNLTGADVDWMWILQDTREVKTGFVERIEDNIARYYVYKGQDEGTTYVCFEPTSFQFKEEALNRCSTNPDTLPQTADGTAVNTTVCPDPTDRDARNLICMP